VRFEVYVDDPAAALRGNSEKRERLTALIVQTWPTLGSPLATMKGKRNSTLAWIGHLMTVTRHSASATVKPDKIKELIDLCDKHDKSNVISLKDVRSFAGKLNDIATVIDAWRPFIFDLWGAMSDTERSDSESKAPPGCLWKTQIAHVIKWIKAFLTNRTGTITRLFVIDAYFNRGNKVSIKLDASPWDMGATLKINNVTFRYIESKLTKEDLDIFEMPLGDCAGQQTWEGLIALVALRAWKDVWANKRVILQITSDNVTALEVVNTLRGKSRNLNIIARELAMLFGDSAFRPKIAQHAPGITNVVCNTLSRLHQPSSGKLFPEFLDKVIRTQVPIRNQAYYLAWSPPVEGRCAGAR
jgi:hypothetical protein